MSFKQIILIIALLALVLCASLVAQTIEPQIDEYIDAQMKLGRFSGAVLVAKDSGILVSKGYGLANQELNVPNTPQTKFRLGSVTKQFTSMLIMILEEGGKLSTDDYVAEYIEDYPNGDKITIHHLLTHTSGIPDVFDIDGFNDIKRDPLTTEEFVDFFKNEQLDFEPGTEYDYSNSGYVLLSYIIEIVTGKSYEDFLTENILKPLEMNDTGMDSHSKVIKNRADGYYPGGDGLINAPYLSMTLPAGGGGLYSTVQDMYKWDRSLYTEKLVSKKSLDKIFTPHSDSSTYCYGWRKAEDFGKLCFQHGGGIEGFVCVVKRYVDDDVFVVVLSNFINSPVREIAKDLAAILFDEEYNLPEETDVFELEDEILISYAGEYELAPGTNLVVTFIESRLFVAPPGQPPIEIFPESETDFFVKAFPAKLSFSKNESGIVIELYFKAGGNDMVAKKVK
ncbi:serine hydrolase [Bacteroidota bacterium]